MKGCWPFWLTYMGQFTHVPVSGHPSVAGQVQDRESLLVEDRRSTTVPCNRPCVSSQWEYLCSTACRVYCVTGWWVDLVMRHCVSGTSSLVTVFMCWLVTLLPFAAFSMMAGESWVARTTTWWRSGIQSPRRVYRLCLATLTESTRFRFNIITFSFMTCGWNLVKPRSEVKWMLISLLVCYIDFFFITAYPGVRDNRSTVNTKTGCDEYYAFCTFLLYFLLP